VLFGRLVQDDSLAQPASLTSRRQSSASTSARESRTHVDDVHAPRAHPVQIETLVAIEGS